jgi:hypothetical protein
MEHELLIEALHERHPGLTPVVAGYYAEGASVCLSRHHEPPTKFGIEVKEGDATASINWTVPNEAIKLSWANHDEATRDGAYAVCLATTEAVEGLVAVGRAHNRTGADYYVGTKGTSVGDFESSYRLEVSGVDRGDRAVIAQRLEQKKDQTRRGDSDLPALAAVVGFKCSLVALAYVDAR